MLKTMSKQPHVAKLKVPLRIMIVEDDEAIRSLLVDLFQEEGYEVRTAAHGRQALALLDESRFDVIVTDMLMPVMDGAELSRAIRAHGDDVPLVVLTASKSEEALARTTVTATFIQKPFDLEVVLSTVDRVVRHHAPPDPDLAR